MKKLGLVVPALCACFSGSLAWSQPKPSADPLLEKAIGLMQTGKTDQATVIFKAAADAARQRKDRRGATEILLLLGNFQGQNGQLQEALHTFDEACRESEGTDLAAFAEASRMLMWTRNLLSAVERQPTNAALAYATLATQEPTLDKLDQEQRTALRSELLTLRIYAYLGFCDKFAGDLAKASAAKELPPATQVFLTAALRQIPVEKVDPATFQRKASLPAEDLAALDEQRPWLDSLRKIALKLNETVTALDEKRGPLFAADVARDLSQRADIEAQLGEFTEAIRSKETAIIAFDRANLFTDSITAKKALADLYLRAGRSASDDLKLSANLIDHIESQTGAFSGESIGTLLARHRDLYDRTLTLLRQQLASVREHQPQDAERAYEQLLLQADRRNFRAPRRDMALYSEVGDRLSANPTFRQRLDELRAKVAARQRKVEEAREQGKTTADFTPLPGLEVNNPFPGLAEAKEQLLAALEDYKRKFVGGDEAQIHRLPASLAGVRAGMGPNDAIVMYYQGGKSDDSLSAAVITAASATREVELPGANPRSVAQLLQQMKDEIIAQAAGPDSAISKLGRILWRPLGLLPKHLTIVLTPDLVGLPFESLSSDLGGPIVQQYTVRYAFGLADGLGQQRAVSTRRQAFVSGAESFVNPALDSLPASREEIDTIRQALIAKGYSVSPSAALPPEARSLFTAAGNFAFLHLSTHSVLDRKVPMFDALAFPQDELFAYDLALSPVRADVAVLSACELFTLRPNRFYPVSGLTTALLARVSPQVISTLWPVNAGATKLFMRRLYDLLLAGQDVPSALAETKRDFIDPARLDSWMAASDVSAPAGIDIHALASPYFWAPFVLVVRSGDPPSATAGHNSGTQSPDPAD